MGVSTDRVIRPVRFLHATANPTPSSGRFKYSQPPTTISKGDVKRVKMAIIVICLNKIFLCFHK